ncbi:Cytochrome d ubiquinol oxidase subunit II [Furfurilactobacillus rossiae]|nr:Cytochrome d ubiquinol oxidase subunit II [Furfurilactobacillus rossiae]QLE63661.1 Cytochrome d ubiquinol oxidase subunit II [Furfurilactobacillus rossiae]
MRVLIRTQRGPSTMSSLQFVWFLLIGLLFAIFFFLEGFDFGVGMSVNTLANNESERNALVRSIGPHWDGNEVYLITAGGAMFASFGAWYASLFSGFYVMFLLVLVALIMRGVSFEFRNEMRTDFWRRFWEWSLTISSLAAPFLLGMIFTDMVKGMPIDAQGDVIGHFTDYVNWFSIVGGVAVALLCYLHGLNFVRLKTEGTLRERARAWGKILYPVLFAGEVVFAILVYVYTDFFTKKPISTLLILAAIVLLSVLAYVATLKDWEVTSFISGGLTLPAVVMLLFVGLFPRVMVANNAANSILIKNASSSAYTLNLMTWIALCILPFVLAYQIWSYWVFYKRIKAN